MEGVRGPSHHKIIEDCNRQLPDGAADSARCTCGYVHTVSLDSTIPSRKCLQMIQKKQFHLTLQI